MDLATLTGDEVYWIYNGLDCCLTEEIRQTLTKQIRPDPAASYAQTMRVQAPFLDMMMRGLLVDEKNRVSAVKLFEQRIDRLVHNFDRLCTEGLELGCTVNPKSHVQVKWLLYEILNLPEKKKRSANGTMVLDSSRETLEEFALTQYWAEPLCNHILAIRDASKSLGFLNTKLDDDQHIRTNLNLAGTNTGRAASSFSDFGTGTNLQNVDSALRYIFVPEKGKVFVNVDLEQADSRNVGALCWDFFLDSHGPEFAGAYLDACESGDLHTLVSKMAYPHLAWGSASDREIADLLAYRDESYRKLSKKLGHGSNYMGQPPTMARHAKLPTQQVVDFQRNYFGAFPCIPAWQEETILRLQNTGRLTHLFGRERHFHGRLDDSKVINAAIAYSPQGMTGDEINHGILQLWRDPRFELLIQVHDSIMFQIDQYAIHELVPIALELLKAPITLRGGREFMVPLEAEVGWNWGYYHPKKNHLGLATWDGTESRKPPRRLSPMKRSLKDVL